MLASSDGLDVAEVVLQQQHADELTWLAVGEAEHAAGGVVEVAAHGGVDDGQPLVASLRLFELTHVRRLREGRDEGTIVAAVERRLDERRPQQLGLHAANAGVYITVVG